MPLFPPVARRRGQLAMLELMNHIGRQVLGGVEKGFAIVGTNPYGFIREATQVFLHEFPGLAFRQSLQVLVTLISRVAGAGFQCNFFGEL